MTAPLFEVRNLDVAIFDQDAFKAGVDRGFVDPAVKRPLGPGWLPGIRDVSFAVGPGEVLSLVGESGMGKTLAVMAALGLLAPTARVVGGEVRYGGERFDQGRPEMRQEPRKRRWRRRPTRRRWLDEVDDPVYARVMGLGIGVVFQDPIASWDPMALIGDQTGEVLEAHTEMTLEEIRDRVFDVLGEVKLPKASKFFSKRLSI